MGVVIAFDDYHGPLARAKAKADVELERFLAKDPIEDVTRYVSLETLRYELVQAIYEVETCLEDDKRFSRPRF